MDLLAAIWMLLPALVLPLAFINMCCCTAGGGDCGTTGFFACQSGTKPTSLTAVISGVTTISCIVNDCDGFNATFTMPIRPPDEVSGCDFRATHEPICND